MGWEVRAGKRYYYRSWREGRTVRKLYIGCDPVADWTAEWDSDRRRAFLAEREQEALHHARVSAAVTQTRQFQRQCRELAEAVLLALGFRQRKRGPWRRWHDAQKVLQGEAGQGQAAD